MFKSLAIATIIIIARVMVVFAAITIVAIAASIVAVVLGAIAGLAVGLHIAGFVHIKEWKPIARALRTRIMERKIRKSEEDSEVEPPANILEFR